MKRLWLALAFALLLPAQEITTGILGGVAPLDGVWKQQTGDDPAWASPAYDDSAWTSVTMPEPVTRGPRGITWYRVRIRLAEPLPDQPVFVLIGPRFPAYELYANGERIGNFGGPLESWGSQRYAQPAHFRLPRARSILLAIRAADWHLPMGSQSAPAAAGRSFVGTEAEIANQESAWRLQRYQRNEPIRLVCLMLLGAAGYFAALALWRRRNYEYLLIGLFVGANSFFRLLQAAPEWLGSPNRLTASYAAALLSLSEYPWLILLVCILLGARPNWRTWTFCALGMPAVVTMFPPVAVHADALSPGILTALVVIATASEGLIYFDLARRAPPHEESHWPTHLAVGVFIGSNVVFYALQLSGGILGGDMMSATEIALRSAILIFVFAMGIILSQRSARADRQQGRLRQELAAAGEVQRLLLSGEPEATGGFTVSPVYLPAAEVGGDFFHVRALPHGELMVLVGDVSGKGMRAALLVSAVIGVLRRETLSSPGEVMAALNRAIHGQTGGGFITCCCARFAADGSVTLANAGHPAPYCDGVEVDAPAGLPLGVLAGSEYEEFVFAGGDWAFVTDGVVEAANSTGELFGFERTREISTKPAAEIAEAARAWGQTDDITVVTVRRAIA